MGGDGGLVSELPRPHLERQGSSGVQEAGQALGRRIRVQRCLCLGLDMSPQLVLPPQRWDFRVPGRCYT